MVRHAFVLTAFLMLPMLTQSQQHETGIAAPVLAELRSGEAASTTASLWRGTPEAEPVYPAPPTMPMGTFRSTDIQPVLAGPLGADVASMQAAALHMFTGTRFGDFVQLKWLPTQGNKSVGFEIERRTQSHPAWETIEYFRSSSKRSGQAYVFNDRLRDDGAVYYRLRQIDPVGKDIASPIISVTPDIVPHSFSIWRNSSEPFQNYGTVSFGLDEGSDVTLTLIDRYGQPLRVLLDNARMQQGHHIIPFGTSDLQPGLYFLRITTMHGSENLVLLHS
ncbi:MAG: hypothetical protein RRA94_00315 [Bacteroidota bacterium]|nr:hypothetical protein [Bacteroidota bacterium]